MHFDMNELDLLTPQDLCKLYVAQGLQSVEAFIWHLGLLLSGSQLSDNSRNKFVLVLEAVRGCRCYTPTLLQAEHRVRP